MVSESTLRKVERFKRGLELLGDISKVGTDEYIRDLKLQSIAERNLQVCIEAIIDLSNIIISRKGFRIPSSYRDTVRVLRENNVLEEKLAKDLENLVGLRNIIVHMYADIRSEIIHENLPYIMLTLRKAMSVLLEYCRKNNIDP